MLAIFLAYLSFLAPLPLLVFAWCKTNRLPIAFSLLTLSAFLFLSAAIRNVKLVLLGGDYSNRLFATIGINILLAIILAIYVGIKRRWIATVAALILALGWLAMGAINIAV